MSYYAPEPLTPRQRDALLVIYYKMNYSVAAADLAILEGKLLITPKHPKGWMCTSSGREYVRSIRPRA